MAYHNNKKHKEVIDCVLRQNALMFANLGSDCSAAEYEKAKVPGKTKAKEDTALG